MYIGAYSFKTETAPVIRTFTDGWDAFSWMCRSAKGHAVAITKRSADGITIGTVDIHGPDEIEVWHSKLPHNL